MTWTRESLQTLIGERLKGIRIIAVSNRAPYLHRDKFGTTECVQPASGMAAALDPVMRACGGVWVAQGTGDADRITSDSKGRLQVPPEWPSYTLRRVFLPERLQAGFYSGLSNGCLWPLCHVAFLRPRFEPEDWNAYCTVNRIFADAVLEEARGEPALVFVQDYHFALLPRMLKERNPDLVIGQFWHIPWPNPEVLRVFPWQKELVEGMLGNDLIGFHMRTHCANFLSTLDQTVEALVDHVAMEARRAGQTVQVRPFPISIDFEAHSKTAASPRVESEAERWWMRIGPGDGPLGISIDRVDYTKGIPERLRAIDSLLRHCPEYRRSLRFVQIGVPSREDVPEYRDLAARVQQMVDEINDRWAMGGWKPIHYFHSQFSQMELMGLHRLADFCVVSSLHDGMNLVAKEFVASRTDGDGVLVLSRFTGAAAELGDAVIFNPFHLNQAREALQTALVMSSEERRRRMRHMRQVVEVNNVYRWAGKLLTTFLRLPQAAAPLELGSPNRVEKEPVARWG
ncbi:MAG: trehalose-6-phosphate synthase [Acidobacteria bacterium]|nr:trehalose-6-phosphate synthase [Acidobacteriota bacterium]